MKIEISNNRHAELEHFEQWKTYERLIEGIPHSQMNRKIIQEAITRVSKIFPENPVHLIEPVEILKSSYVNRRGYKHYELPKITCVACITYIQEKPELEINSYTILWLQDDFEPHIPTKTKELIKKIEWKKNSF